MPKINRPHSIVVKVTADERDAITRLALKEKLTAANWLRSLGMNVVTAPAPSFKELTSIIETPTSTPESPLNDVPEPPKKDSLAGTAPERFATTMGHIQNDMKQAVAVNAEQRIYDVVLKNKGKAVADAWLKERHSRPANASPARVEIGEPDVPGHLNLFYQSLIKNQGKAAADFWLISQLGGKKISL